MRRCVAILLILALLGVISGCGLEDGLTDAEYAELESYYYEISDILESLDGEETQIALEDVPDYSGSPYVAINGNTPYFEQTDYTTTSFEHYSALDSLGRCGTAYACIGRDLMPTEERGRISQVKPSGWQSVQYDNVDGKNLYNRCHLIGFQLTGENANAQNLITGTRYLNVQGMLPFEDLVADYVKETDHHVLYRVTPAFEGENLVANGVLMEGQSVEDDEVCFCVYAYNVQPGIEINYADGTSRQVADPDGEMTYVLNTGTRKFHDPSCEAVSTISEGNRQEYTGSRESLIAQGYTPCKGCNP